ncbi:MAG: SAM-dependent methyltransferase [Hyphomonadaceae bacterium]|nr:SAM-dependent methyltransferase [Hyphomonadaceae bacterium]
MSLKQKLIEHIKEAGPMTVADYMAACLHDPEHGYYATRPALGGAGADFLTAPEASQMFGELIGLWCAHEWAALGKPAINLIELGPGRGVLMQDAWRATQRVEGFHDAANVVFIETSAPLREQQAERTPHAEWAAALEDAPPGPCLIVGNEFLDCMPIRQFARVEDGWREKLVGVSESDDLIFGLSALLPAADDDVREGAVREIAPALDALVYEVERRLHAAPGRALFIDYGYAAPEGADTLQALKRHAKVDPLESPGEADLTAHVDFARVSHLAREASLDVHGPIAQGRFLKTLGIDVRVEMLARANPDQVERVARELKRLTHPDDMGALFKAICLSSPNLPPPAGF